MDNIVPIGARQDRALGWFTLSAACDLLDVAYGIGQGRIILLEVLAGQKLQWRCSGVTPIDTNIEDGFWGGAVSPAAIDRGRDTAVRQISVGLSICVQRIHDVEVERAGVEALLHIGRRAAPSSSAPEGAETPSPARKQPTKLTRTRSAPKKRRKRRSPTIENTLGEVRSRELTLSTVMKYPGKTLAGLLKMPNGQKYERQCTETIKYLNKIGLAAAEQLLSTRQPIVVIR
jgi:hypothetical protein